MFDFFKTKQPHVHYGTSAMESETIQKNGVSPKDLNRRSRGNFLTAILLTVFCLSVVNAYGQTWQIGYPTAANVTATFNSGTLTISGTGAMQDWSSGYYAPWNIGTNGSTDFDHITSVIINSGVTSIGNNAFSTAHKISYLSIPNTVKRIGETAFYNCLSLLQLDIPYGVTTIERDAFSACFGLTSINIPASVSSIGEHAFGTTSGGGSSMHLTDVTVNWTNPLYVPSNTFGFVTVSNVNLHVPTGTQSLYGATPVWQDFHIVVESATDQTWYIGHPDYNSNVKATLSGGTLTISGTGNMCDFWCSSEGEAPWYFYRDDIKTVIIQEGVTNIGMRAFKDCKNLESISIPNSVTKINGQAFKDCSKLNTVTIENGNSTLEFAGYRGSNPCSTLSADTYDWFEGCASLTTLYLGRNYSGDFTRNIRATLTTLTIGSGVTVIGSGTFANCGSLANVTIEDDPSTLSFPYNSFDGCNNIRTVHLGRNLSNAYYNFNSIRHYSLFMDKTRLSTLTIGNDVKTIDNYLFCGCEGLTSPVTIPNQVETIGDYAFYGCKQLETVNITAHIGDKVQTIGQGAFESCNALTAVTIPKTVYFIGNYAFVNCAGLTNVTIEDDPSTLSFPYNSFDGSNNIRTVHLGRNLSNAYYNFNNIRHYSLFRDKTRLSTLTIGNDVKTIDPYLFCGCEGLTSPVTIPNKVETIGNYAFYGCKQLETVNITAHVGDKLQTIGQGAFESCNALTAVTIPKTVNTIGGSAFADCTGLVNVTIENDPNTLSFPYNSFDGCNNIQTVHLGRNLSNAYYNFNNIRHYSLFRDKTRLSTLTIGNDVKTIDHYLFYGCEGLTQITSNLAPPTLQSTTFNGVDKDIPIHIDCDYLTAYKTAPYWKDFTNYQCPSSGIEENLVQKCQIYPNPAKNEIFIQSESPIKKLEIYSLTGALLLVENNFSEKISVSALPQGVYTFRIYTDNGLVIRKVVKE